MDNNKIMIVGTGNVGASIAFAIMNQRTVINEIILTDIKPFGKKRMDAASYLNGVDKKSLIGKVFE